MKRPIILLTLSYVVGLVAALIIFEKKYFLAIALISAFIILLWQCDNHKVLILCSIVVILGSVNYFVYYARGDNSTCQGEIRVLEEKSTYFRVKHRSKLYVLLKKDELNSYKIDEGAIISGDFLISRNVELYKGIVGSIDIIGKPKISKDLFSYISQGRQWLYEEFSKVLGKEKAGIVTGLCFGSTKYIEESSINTFKDLGIIHVISVSGFHIVLLYSSFKGIFGKKISLILVLFFVLFTGAQAATVRAFFMLLILSMAQILHKNYDNLTALCLSAMLILIIKPYLVTDLGFNLSCLSTLGILIFNKKINRVLYILPDAIRSSISLTLSSQLIVFPYGSLILKTFSTGLILGNLIILPVYTAIIYVSLISIIFINSAFLFSLINRINLLLFGISDSWFYLLNKLSFSEIAISEEIVIMYTVIFITFILMKANKTKYRFLPIFLLPAIMIFNYRFLPSIEVIDMGNTRYIEARYKRDRYFFTAGNSARLREKVTNYPGSEKIMTVKNNRYALIFGDIKLNIKEHREIKKAVVLEIWRKEKDTTPLHYDIINMDKKDISYDFYRRRKLISYTALGNKIIITKGDGGSQVAGYRQTRK